MQRLQRGLLFVVICGAVPACGDDDAVAASDAGALADRVTPGADAPAPLDGAPIPPPPPPPSDGGIDPVDLGPSPRDAGTVPLPFCRVACDTVADCVQPSPAYDEDNYRCTDALCEYTGCTDDAECQSAFMSSVWVCRNLGSLRTCRQSCSTASDCGQGTAAFDGDNYTCDDGVCSYVGCNTDDECASTFFDDRYVCREVAPADTGLPIPVARTNCVPGCSTSADCGSPSAAFDADNYACDDGACRYLGCRDDAECRSSLMNDAYVCR